LLERVWQFLANINFKFLETARKKETSEDLEQLVQVSGFGIAGSTAIVSALNFGAIPGSREL
jgi:hypothetical protein